jgi:tRNA-dihydrouridine synthase
VERNDDLSALPRPFFILAPLDDVTDTVFRRVVASCAAPDLFFTEFVNVDGLMSPGRSKLLKKLKFTPDEQPLIAQIWGLKPDNFRVVAEQIADGSLARELGLPEGVNFAGIDLNTGCPEKTVVKHGACSGLINNPELAVEIIKATQAGAAGRLPVSVKARIGFNEVNMPWLETLLNQNLAMLTVHGRTRKEMSKVPAHWDIIGQVRELRDRLAPQTLIVGNGDVMSRAQGLELAEKYQLDGIMVGRGIFHDPFVFSQDSPWENFTEEQRIDLFRRHVQLFADTWRSNERSIHTLNKFCKIYINNFDGAKELREQLMAATSADSLLSILSRPRHEIVNVTGTLV